MGKALIIAEKPSVAGDIAKALGGFKRTDDYFESDQYVVSSAVGHLLTIVPPPGVEAVRGNGLSNACRSSRRTSIWNRLRRAKTASKSSKNSSNATTSPS